jgi:hypothetical protein
MALYATAAALSQACRREERRSPPLLVHNMELENMSMRDELTQLFNRRYLFDRLERELTTAKGFQRPLGFIAMELRPLSHVNETYGYEAGDRVLTAFGRFLMECLPATSRPRERRIAVIPPDTSTRRFCRPGLTGSEAGWRLVSPSAYRLLGPTRSPISQGGMEWLPGPPSRLAPSDEGTGVPDVFRKVGGPRP